MSATLADLHADWAENVRPQVIAAYSADDEAALSESWNDYTDARCKDGAICDLQYHYCPAWDEPMPSDDRAFVLRAMGLRMTATRTEAPAKSDWPADASHWHVVLRRGDASLSTEYRMGSAHKGSPELPPVLWCLLTDADSADQPFEDWCSDYGYDEDSRRALRTYETCRETGRKLGELFSAAELTDLRELFEDF